MIAKQPNFMEQETLLQIHCKKLGAMSNKSPIAQPEIAIVGIKFDLGVSKIPYKAKQNKVP